MAIRFATRLFVIALMICLADVEIPSGEEQGVHHVAMVTELLDNGFGSLQLSLIAIEEATAVLRTKVGTDAIGLCGIMNLEKHLT